MTDQHSHGSTHDDHDHGVGHIVSPKILIATAFVLVVLTAMTVASAQFDWASVDLPEMNVWIAMGIAAIKASLVCLFFMHLYWDRPFNSILLVGSVGFVGIFMSFAIIDTMEYRESVTPGDAITVQGDLVELSAVEAEVVEHGGGHGDDQGADDLGAAEDDGH